ncbi:hypothetical protein H2199_007533 [Coniosporium tulheliwenetii]|uniref:Uncharacterized protein n=1 Tax=Coniosporium tulheliwenetii TaxID=3383036 RepID=A0ACC2YPS6_9PEZI|nr:hypothetical protein H2199_007533 [Cladosporium sp. JES 115]
MDPEFHDHAKSLRPDQFLKPNRFWVGILYHERKPEAISQETDFLWIKAHGKITVQTIQNEYFKKTFLDVVLKLDDDVPSEGAKLAEVNHYNDNIIIFRAVDRNSPEARTRRPLQPTNGQTYVKSSTEEQPPAKPPPVGKDMGSSASHVPKPAEPNIPVQPPAKPLDPSAATYVNPHAFPQSRAHPMPRGEPESGANYGIPPDSRLSSTYAAPQPIKGEGPESGFAHPQGLHTTEAPTPEPLFQPSGAPSRPDSMEPQNVYLQKLMTEESPELLEAGVQKSLGLLDSLKEPLYPHLKDTLDADNWLKSIEALEKQATRARTVLGVVGNTGAGKSSVINALLDEERLVPTNCMRACTAVVTEMSWNDSEQEHSRYRAEVEFIKPEDWAKELEVLYTDLLDSEGKVTKDVYNADSEAGIAYAKIRAVYPKLTKEMMGDQSVQQLMKVPAVRDVLGTTRQIVASASDRFYKQLQFYVDSKEKATGQEKDKKKKEPKQMEFWPLIKVVKIYTKSAALKTGAIVVDLPGVHDSNAARAAVAEGYMKQCTGLWIVAPITRAVDDKAAKSLLGNTFRRQLKYDGTYGNVTFICSKTDDISVTEAEDSLNLDLSEKWDQEEALKRDLKEKKKKEFQELKESKAVYKEVYDEADEQLDTWESLLEKVQAESPKQRKKNRRNSDFELELDSQPIAVDSSDSESEVARSSDGGEPWEPLTEERVEEKLADIKSNKKRARQERINLDGKIHEVQKEIRSIQSQLDEIKAEISAVCIAGRNRYSKGAIQQDFAAGIKELDQENAMEENEATFNPEEDLRDYDEVARSLPVFCVSSRAYQKLSGRLQRDEDVPGFKTLEETEIPQLQAHCLKLTESGRITSCRRFLSSFSQLTNSMGLWASNDGSGLQLSDTQMRSENAYLQEKLNELEKGLEAAVAECLREMKEALAENIFEKYKDACEKAEQEALPTSQRWGAHRNEGGLFWATYKAVCRRNGVFTGAGGLHDFNGQLFEPVMKLLATGWEKAFARRLPNVLESYKKSSNTLLKSFHRSIEARARSRGAGAAGMNVLAQQLNVYDQQFAHLAAQMVEVIQNMQRDANREFVPVIADCMTTAYEQCVAESGKSCYLYPVTVILSGDLVNQFVVIGIGSFMRMKRAMTDHVSQESHTMFRKATETVQTELIRMCRAVEEHMANKADEVFVSMKRDYTTVLTGAHLPQGQLLPKPERTLRAEVAEVLKTAEPLFKELVDGAKDGGAEESTANEGAGEEDGTNADDPMDTRSENGDHWDNDDTILNEGESNASESVQEDQEGTPNDTDKTSGPSLSAAASASVSRSKTSTPQVEGSNTDASATPANSEAPMRRNLNPTVEDWHSSRGTSLAPARETPTQTQSDVRMAGIDDDGDSEYHPGSTQGDDV